MIQNIILCLGLILWAALIATACVWLLRQTRNRTRLIGANIGEGTHESASLSKRSDAAHTLRHLLVKQGTDADHIAINGASDRPMGTCPDTPEAAEDLVSVVLLSGGKGTRKVVASEAIAANLEVFTAANGKVQDEPTVAGTYYRIGTARTAAGADLDLMEIDPCEPERLVVMAALTSTDGTAAAAADLAALKVEAEKIGDDVRAISVALAAAKVVTIAA